MPRPCSTLIGLVVLLATAHNVLRAADDIGFEPLPPLEPSLAAELSLRPPPLVDQPPQQLAAERMFTAPPTQYPSSAAGTAISGNATPTGEPIDLKGPAEIKPPPAINDFMGYRYSGSELEWIPGGSKEFGIFSVLLGHYLPPGIQSGIIGGFGFHVFTGPEQSDMSPRAYDFSLGYQMRHQFGDLTLDLAGIAQVSSDFNGDAHKGLQYPSHGVAYYAVDAQFDVVLGVDYLDRADIKLLPVAGVVWKPNPEMRFELVFPRPRAVFQLSSTYRLYFSGELGGGTWAIERPALGNTLATYSDLRVCIGLESADESGHLSAIEIGYLFDRRLEYTSGVGNTNLDDAVMLRVVAWH